MDIDNLVAVSRLTEALSRATTLDGVYAAALDALGQSLHVERASILLFDENDVCAFVAWRGISEGYRAQVNGHTPWRPDTPHPEPLCIADVDGEASVASLLPALRAEGIRALAFFPLPYRDRVLGKFTVYYHEPHAFYPFEVELARTIAGQIAFGVARITAEQALRRERERLSDLITSVPAVLWETTGTPGLDQRLTFVTPNVEQLLGYPPEAWYANATFWNDVIVSPERGDVERLSLDAVDNGVPAVHTFRMRTRDGRLIWAEVRVAATQEGGRLVLRGVTLDVTARREAERRRAFLSKASGLLASSLDCETTLAHLARLVVNDLGDWSVVYLEHDSELRRLTVDHRDPTKREETERMKSLPITREVAAMVRRVMHSGEPLFVRSVEPELLKLWGGHAALLQTVESLGMTSLMTIPLCAGGRAVGAMSIVSADPGRLYDDDDVSLAVELGRRAGYAIENARLYRAAQEANRAKDEFLATLSHELRTPMTATLGWATMLRMGDTSPENFDLAVDTIERSTRAQAKLIDEILDVSRIVTGKLQLNVAPVNLQTVVEAALDAVRPSVAAKGIALQTDFGRVDGVPTGDASRLQQVIWNLLSNAVKFTPSGGSITVAIDQPSRDSVRVSVCDTGQGIPRKFLPVIFERFRQADSSTTRAYGGLGLGLAIVKNIVELHGGSVTAASDGEGRGAMFTLTLPLATAPAPATTAVDGDAPPLSLAGVVILLVEDEDDTRRMLAATLRNFGASVLAVGSVPAALEALRTSSPNIVVSDIGMPGEDGYSLMMKIRSGAVERARDLPAVALTAYARAEDRERVLASGFAYHLTKPVDPTTMARVIREAVRPLSS